MRMEHYARIVFDLEGLNLDRTLSGVMLRGTSVAGSLCSACISVHDGMIRILQVSMRITQC